MFFNAKSNQVNINGSTMYYLEFGKGTKPLIILPGLGDGLNPVYGQMQAVAMALSYKEFAKRFKVLMFSRKNELKDGYTTKEMARDQKQALDQLGIKSCYLMGVSQGGMIAQHLAIDYPEAIEKLIIGVSSSRQNDLINSVVNTWIDMAMSNDYKSLIIDICEKLYSEKKLKQYRLVYPLLTRVGKPNNYNRFLIQANACLNHNVYNELNSIKCPTLIVGGAEDKVVGVNASKEMAKQIVESKLIVYEGLGHASYEESNDFKKQVVDFLL